MRLLLAPFLCACILCAASGCNLPKRLKEGTARSSGTDRPFTGTPPTDSPSSPTQVSHEDSGADTLASAQPIKPGKGRFIGQVIDSARRRVPRARIKVIEINPPKERADAAPLVVLADKQGYFDVGSLDAGRWYRLEARMRDGNRDLTGSVKVQCPSVRVTIALTNDEPATGQDKESEIEKKEGGNKKASPSEAGVRILPPTRAPAGGDAPAPAPEDPSPAPPPPSADVPQFPPPVNSANDPSLLAKDKDKANSKDGFPRDLPPTVNIPGRDPQRKPVTPYSPPAPPMKGGGDSGLKPSSAPSAALGAPVSDANGSAESEEIIPAKLVVPSCVRIGQRVENFALYDYDGNAWELKKKRRGKKLVLIDFWFAGCAPCRKAMPYLARLDRYYRPYGLQVVGIANEEGSLAEKQDAVRAVRSRNQIDYPILFTGGGASKTCPVLKQFEVDRFPTLILLDESGKIVWRGTGLNPRSEYDLEMDIRRRLGIR